MLLLILLLAWSIISPLLAISPDDYIIDTWVDLQCIQQEPDVDYEVLSLSGPRRLLELPLAPHLSCRAWGRAAATGTPEAPWRLIRMEFDIRSSGCSSVFFCRDQLVRVSLQYDGQNVAGMSSEWNTKISDLTSEMARLHGRENAFYIGPRELLYMAYMIQPISLLNLTLGLGLA